MDKKYLAKIIATDNEGLQMISACCAGAKVKISDIKFLQSSNKIFLLSVQRKKIETGKKIKKLIVSVNLIMLIMLSQKILIKKIKI